MNKKEYICKECGKKIIKSEKELPKCCGKKMEKLPLDVCVQPAHAEHSRSMDSDESCDDGRSG